MNEIITNFQSLDGFQQFIQILFIVIFGLVTLVPLVELLGGLLSGLRITPPEITLQDLHRRSEALRAELAWLERQINDMPVGEKPDGQKT